MINVISFPNLGLSFTINRVAFSIGGFSVYWYGILIALGLLLAIVYGVRECPKVGISHDDLFNMLIIALPVAIICARTYYVIFSWDFYKNDIAGIFDIRNGGIAIYGAVIGAVAVVLSYCRIKKLNLGEVLDVLAIGLLIGQVIGRWGNFVNGEAFGSVTTLPWAMTVERSGSIVGEMVHPTFLYESLWNLAGVGILLAYKKIKKFGGEIFAGYMAWYGLGRAMIEGLRADSLYIGPLRVSQMLALACFIAGAIIIIYKRKKR